MPDQDRTDAYYQNFVSLMRFLDEFVIPPLDGRTRNPPSREDAVGGTYCRMVGWGQSLERLYGVQHMQAITTGNRSLFELLTDINWFDAFPQTEWVTKYFEFPKVIKYHEATKVINICGARPDLKIDRQFYENYIKQRDAIEDTKQLVLRIWGTTNKCKTAWPVHWTGCDLAVRCERIDRERKNTDCFEMYRQWHGIFCWDVHSGATPYLGCDFTMATHRLELGYHFGFKFLFNATGLLSKILNLNHEVDTDRLKDLLATHRELAKSLKT